MDKEILHNQGRFKGFGGLELFYQCWVVKKPKAAIIIIHGIGEHSSRYLHVGRYFGEVGYSVYTYDQRGNGRSEGKKGHVKDFNEYLLDLKCFIEFLSLKEKVFILGHSLGGLITIRFAMDYPEDIAGIIASSPALGLSMKVPLLKRLLGYGLHLIYPEFIMIDNSISSKYLSHDPQVCQAYDNDPLVHRLRSSRFFVEFVKTSSSTANEPQKLRVPSLFLQAGDDKIVSVEAVKRFYAGVSAKTKTLKIYPEFYHEILNEVQKERVFKDIEVWLTSFLSRP